MKLFRNGLLINAILFVGLGIGGTMERATYLSRKALLNPVDSHNENKALAILEEELLEEINKQGIGTAGFGGTTTALAVNVLTNAMHIAGLPVSVNIGCHATRPCRRKTINEMEDKVI